MRRFAVFFSLFFLLLVANAFAASPKPVIVDVRGHASGKEARVLFTLQNAFSPEMVEALKSGIEISFKTAVYVERVHRNWFNETLGEVTFWRSVRYDALARVYRLHRGKGEELQPDIFAALAGMTQYEVVVPLSADAEPGKRYRAYARTRLDKVGLSEPLRAIFFFSTFWDIETGWTSGYLRAP